jgi:tripartite-type tricarboxylate transporter receptor subunit TctC
MMMPIYRRLLTGTLIAATAYPACAQEFPSRPIRIVVPSTPGGGLDVLARAVTPALTEKWKQQIVVDNRAGAGGIIGTEIVAKSVPDGHTLLLVTVGFVTNPFIYRRLPYTTPKDFSPITILGVTPNVLVAHPSLPVQSVKDLIALARDKPGQLTYASSGVGTGGHLSMELFRRMARIEFIHVPYKGAGASTVAVVAGESQLLITAIGAAIPQIRANRLRAIAVTSTKRADVLLDVPTIAESGLPGYSAVGWYAMFGPAHMPKQLIGRIYSDVLGAIRRPDVAAQLHTLGFDFSALPPDEFGRFVAKEMEIWGPVIKEAGIRAE